MRLSSKDQDAIAKLYIEGLDRSQEYDWSNPYKDDMAQVYRDDRKSQIESPNLNSQREKQFPQLKETPGFYNALLSSVLEEFNEWQYEDELVGDSLPKLTMNDIQVVVQELFAHGLVDTNVPYDFENDVIDENDTEWISFVETVIKYIRDNF